MGSLSMQRLRLSYNLYFDFVKVFHCKDFKSWRVIRLSLVITLLYILYLFFSLFFIILDNLF